MKDIKNTKENNLAPLSFLYRHLVTISAREVGNSINNPLKIFPISFTIEIPPIDGLLKVIHKYSGVYQIKDIE